MSSRSNKIKFYFNKNNCSFMETELFLQYYQINGKSAGNLRVLVPGPVFNYNFYTKQWTSRIK